MMDWSAKLLSLITSMVSLITAVVSLKIAVKGRRHQKDLAREVNDISTRVQRIATGVPICIEGPIHTKGSPGHVTLRVKLENIDDWMFVAVSQNRPDSVWVQRLDRPDTEGRLRLEAYGLLGRYVVYGACDDTTITRFQELQAQAANGKSASIHDVPKGAIQICAGEA